jgi:hypothetical protein
VSDRKKTSAELTSTIVLDRAVALVLFEFLSRTTDEEGGEPLTPALADPAELPALWALMAALEEVMTEPLDDDYRALLAEARAKVAAKWSGG